LFGDGPAGLLVLPLLATQAFTTSSSFTQYSSEHSPAALLAIGCSTLLLSWDKFGRAPQRGSAATERDPTILEQEGREGREELPGNLFLPALPDLPVQKTRFVRSVIQLAAEATLDDAGRYLREFSTHDALIGLLQSAILPLPLRRWSITVPSQKYASSGPG
jgi:hypothetical protein